MREWQQQDVVVSKKLFADFTGLAPRTILNMIRDGRLAPDRFSLAFRSEAFSLSYFVEWCDRRGYAVPWEQIEERMSQGGGRVVR